jgi:holo-[acyl-carrier protein] synthase
MILGIGLDVCEVKRLKQAMARPGFARRVFDAIERRDCDRRARRFPHYAARFAAKEAYLKALGTGWGGGVGWTDVAVRSDGRRPPTLSISGAAARIARARGVSRSHLALTHDGGYAAALVVLEGRLRRRHE